ncbi:hypothetical protein EDD86DRAFT_233286 [Gorgonomyces haynaldii]|nr:hypothetical protein EDD86DRAFT_233286 [Gorgonomyces haynaldii]
MVKRKLPQIEHTSIENPYGIKPLGNLIFGNGNEIRTKGLGHFCSLGDQIIVEWLSSLDYKTLVKLGQTSKAWYCFVNVDDLWRQLYTKHFKDFEFVKDWKTSFKSHFTNPQPETIIRCDGMYSDLLFTSWRCTHVPLEDLCSWNDTIDKRSQLSMQDFMNDYCLKNKPVIITDIVKKWNAYKHWDLEYFLHTYPDKMFHAEAFNVTFKSYYAYMLQQHEESPLYLFDKTFARDSVLQNDYQVPEYFAADLFKHLGDERPDYRWLIVGPKRSGSTFHVDPNATSAWNAIIRGRKKWVMYPPESVPPGVFPSSDGSQVTSPVSVAEWFMNWYDPKDIARRGGIECVCEEGELIYVPSGWWHIVLNLEDCIALTQNFVDDGNLALRTGATADSAMVLSCSTKKLNMSRINTVLMNPLSPAMSPASLMVL